MADLDDLVAGIAAGGAGLAVDADLRIELTTAAGDSTTATVTGRGRQVRVEARRPELLLGAVDRADVGRIADLLTAAGVTVAVHGPRGPVATLGAGVGPGNRLGRAATGSDRVAVAPRGAARLVRDSRPVRIGAAALAAAVVGFVLLRRVRAGAGPL